MRTRIRDTAARVAGQAEASEVLILHRRQHDAATRDYIARRVADGKTSREANRCLKRYLARNLYRLLEHPPITT